MLYHLHVFSSIFSKSLPVFRYFSLSVISFVGFFLNFFALRRKTTYKFLFTFSNIRRSFWSSLKTGMLVVVIYILRASWAHLLPSQNSLDCTENNKELTWQIVNVFILNFSPQLRPRRCSSVFQYLEGRNLILYTVKSFVFLSF